VKGTARQRSRERLEERERVILDAAARLFATSGFHATSTRRIAGAARVSEGTVFHYFGSKNELMLAILDRFYHGTLNPRAAGILDTIMDTRDRLRSLALAHVEALAADSALMLRLLQVYVGVDLEFMDRGDPSPLRTLNREYVSHLDRILREGMERGDLRADLELRPLRDLFFGSLEYGLRTHLVRHGEARLDDCVDALLDPIWRGIAADDTAASDPGTTIERLERAADRLERAADSLAPRGAAGDRSAP